MCGWKLDRLVYGFFLLAFPFIPKMDSERFLLSMEARVGKSFFFSKQKNIFWSLTENLNDLLIQTVVKQFNGKF